MTDNPNAVDEDGVTPIHSAVRNGHIEIVKILAPLTVNPILMLQKRKEILQVLLPTMQKFK